MAKLPGYLKCVGWEAPPKGETGYVRVIVRIRWWHPMLWLSLAKAMLTSTKEKR